MFLAYGGEQRDDHDVSDEHYDGEEELMDENGDGKPIST